MSAAAAAAAAIPPKKGGKSSAKSGGSNKAALLFVGGIAVLAGAVGYAKWSADHPVRKTPSAKAAEKKAAKEEKAAAAKEVPATPAEAPVAAAKEEEVERKKKPAADVKAPFAGASDDAAAAKKEEAKKKAAEEAAKKKKIAEDEAAKKKAEAEEEEEAPMKKANIKPLVEALSTISKTNLEDTLDIETDVSRRPYFAGHHVFAKNEIEAGAPVLSLAGSLQFSVRTADKSLQQGLAVLVHHAASIPSVKEHIAHSPYYNVSALFPKTAAGKSVTDLLDEDDDGEGDSNNNAVDETEAQPNSALDGDLHLLVLSMALEKRKGKSSIWHPWIESLPPIHHLAQHHGLFVSDGEFSGCLPNRGQHIVNEMRVEMLWIRNATAELCRATVPKLEPKLDAYRANPKQAPKFTELERATVMARYLTCDVSQSDLDWAYTIISSRSHLVGNVRTIFPLVDVLPYAVSATLKPGQIQATDDGKILSVEFVAARKIEADEPLSFRTNIREPIEAVIAQGFFDTDFFTDNNVPIGIFYQYDKDGETFNSPDLGNIVHCMRDFQARSVPESGEISPEMLLCSELVFLKNATATADFELDKLAQIRSEHVENFIAEQQRAAAEKEKEPQTFASISKVGPRSASVANPILTDEVRQTVRDKAIAFITKAVNSAVNVYSTRVTCSEDARPFLGELQSHNDYVVSILEKTKLILGIEPEAPPMADH